MTPQVYLLAAGNGVRAGGPKAFKKYDGKTLLEKHLSFLLGRFAPQEIAISIQPDWRDRCSELNPGVHWTSVAPEGKPLASLQALLKTSPVRDWGFFYHVDMPLWDAGVFDALEAQARGLPPSSCDAVVPQYKNRRGHPVLISAGAAKDLHGLDAASGRLDVWLKSRRITAVDVASPAILENWNQ